MKWIAISLLTTLFGVAQANDSFSIETPKELSPPDIKFHPTEIQSQFPYFTLGLGPCPIPLPVFGAGYRMQKGHNGFDVSVSATTVVYATGLKGTGLYQYYFKPNLSSQFYVGVGPTIGGVLGEYHHDEAFFVSPEVTIGKQYRNEADDTRFIQAEINWPTFSWQRRFHVVEMPIVIFQYGMAF